MEDREQFARDNFNLIYAFIDAYHLRRREDEIIDLLYIAYTKAIDGYDPEKGKFSTIAFEYMRREYLRNYRIEHFSKRNNDEYKFIPLDSTLTKYGTDTTVAEVIADPNVNVEEDTLKKLFDEETFINVVEAARFGKVGKKNLLSKREKQLFELLYIEKLNQTEAAERMGVSRQFVNAVYIKMIRRLRAWFRNHGNIRRKKEENIPNGYGTYVVDGGLIYSTDEEVLSLLDLYEDKQEK